ncbi:MAG TPA: aldo/keto reductase [Candidatus Saccharimonadales bacterium]|nr:aldo/keto reductase [Candidatus Saccharimonadales bacterium]
MTELSAANAGTVKIGDITVNRLGLGTNRIGNNQSSREILRWAVSRGINFFDTAIRYGWSEEIIGQTLAPYPPGITITTKGGWSDDNSPKTLEARINRSLQLLKLSQIPLWQLHRVDERVPLAETMTFLKSQVSAGKVRHVGLSEVSVRQIETARQVMPIASVQNHYNLQNRQHDDVIDYCERHGIVFMPFFPLASGSSANSPALGQLAQKYQVTPIQIAIAWLLKRAPIMLVIPGTLSKEHLDENITATDIELSDKDFASL